MTLLRSIKRTLPVEIRIAAEMRVVVECRLVVTVAAVARPAPRPRPEPGPPRIRPPRELVSRYVKALAAGRQLTLKVDDLVQPAEPGRRRRL